MTGLDAGWLGNKCMIPGKGQAVSPSPEYPHRVCGSLSLFSVGTAVTQLGNEADNQPPSSAKLRIHLAIYLNSVHRDSFTLTLVFH
jgi:hypothetical protein